MVYTDGIHLVADSLEELHSFAINIHLKPDWFQNHINHPHYKLWGIKVPSAIKNGAKPASPRKILSKSIKLGNEGLSPAKLMLKQLDAVLEMDGYFRNSEPRKLITELSKLIETPITQTKNGKD